MPWKARRDAALLVAYPANCPGRAKPPVFDGECRVRGIEARRTPLRETWTQE